MPNNSKPGCACLHINHFGTAAEIFKFSHLTIIPYPESSFVIVYFKTDC